MKLIFQPTLTDIQGMLGENLYVELIWMSRERDRRSLAEQRFSTWASKMSAWNAGATPEPVYAGPETLNIGDLITPETEEVEAPHLDALPDLNPAAVHELTSLLEKARPSASNEDFPVRASAQGGRR